MCDEISESSMMDEENKVNIEETAITWIKSEAHEEVSDFEEKDVKQYKITVEYDNIHGETSDKIKFKEDSDNLISSLDNDEMENTIVKLENVKQEEEGSFNIFLCSKCNGNYRGYCLKCSTLLCVLNSAPIANIKSELNAIPIDILEIRETYTGKGVFLLKTLPKNVILGPFEGISGIESTVGHSWRICDNKLLNIENSNWMKDVFCAANILFKNLDIYQIDGNLYFQTSREIIEGEELLIYYNEEEIQKSDDTKECLYTPPKHEKLPEIFACTLCCLGFGTDECLMEHKMKCPRREQTRNMEDFELVECHYCKMWLEKQEHEEYHTAYCSEKHDRMWYVDLEASGRTESIVEEKQEHLSIENIIREYDCAIWSETYEQGDHQYLSRTEQEISLNQDTLAKHANNERAQISAEKKYKCSECSYDTNCSRDLKVHRNKHTQPHQCNICKKKFAIKGNLERHVKNKHLNNEKAKRHKCPECSFESDYKDSLRRHLTTHNGNKPFQCNVCMKKITNKLNLQIHMKTKHAVNGSMKDYKCSQCSFQTNYKDSFRRHVNGHNGVKPLQCAICKKKFTHKNHFTVHMKDKHTEKGSEKEYKCSECSFESNNKNHILRHLNTHTKPYQCKVCKMKFAGKNSLKTHTKNKHGENEKDHKCTECSYQTNYKHLLKNHINTHKGIKPFECEICMRKFSIKDSLKAHIKNKHTENAKNHKCTECPYRTNYKNAFETHLKLHKESYECGICSRKFSVKNSLDRHVKDKHLEFGKDYQCPECSYQTNYKHHFQTHLNVHTGIKPFDCGVCKKKFTQKHHLKAHIKHMHTKAGRRKNYKCSECTFRTNRKSYLQNHLNKHKKTI